MKKKKKKQYKFSSLYAPYISYLCQITHLKPKNLVSWTLEFEITRVHSNYLETAKTRNFASYFSLLIYKETVGYPSEGLNIMFWQE